MSTADQDQGQGQSRARLSASHGHDHRYNSHDISTPLGRRESFDLDAENDHDEEGPRLEDMAWFTIRSGDGSARARRNALVRTYLLDWLLTIVLGTIFFSLDNVPGFKRQFSIDDPTLRFPYAENERVPPFALYLIAIGAPFVLQIVINLLTIRSWWDFHNGSLGLLFGLALTGSITQFTKITVGRPRPDVISRCQPLSGISNPEYGLVSVAICTRADDHILKDGWRSFPSGHSSLSFAGLGFLSFYLAGKLHLFDEKGHTSKAWLALTPLSGAALVAISRTMDYRHHWQDVLVGSLLGLLMSYFSYRQYYPHLSSPRSHRPFAPRIAREPAPDEEAVRTGSTEPILPTHARPTRIVGGSLRRARSEGNGEAGTGTVVSHPPVRAGELYKGVDHTYPGYRDDEGEAIGAGLESGRNERNLREHGRVPSEDMELMPSAST